ncbi:MAG: hypothetical protein LBL41_04890 [Bifidobacteriaceae bacterium]|jgi:flavodoxin|nr:hypothetical protein [Bifidobacteriaceae bacterium]
MRVEVRYLSKSGNTAKIAEAIANAVNVSAKTINEQTPAYTDLLFLGGAIYGFGLDDRLKLYIELLPKSIKRVTVFSTTALLKSAYPQIAKLLKKRDIPVSENEFHCRGKFINFHKEHPNATDLENATIFAIDELRDANQALR